MKYPERLQTSSTGTRLTEAPVQCTAWNWQSKVHGITKQDKMKLDKVCQCNIRGASPCQRRGKLVSKQFQKGKSQLQG